MAFRWRYPGCDACRDGKCDNPDPTHGGVWEESFPAGKMLPNPKPLGAGLAASFYRALRKSGCVKDASGNYGLP